MRLTCCRCGQAYEYDYVLHHDDVKYAVIHQTIDLTEGNTADIISCPHCGLEHTVLFMKRGKWK